MICTLSDLKRFCESAMGEVTLRLWRKPRRSRIRLFGRFGPVVPVVRRFERTCEVIVNPVEVVRYLKDVK